ncbi:MAG TPA: RDD family protein [Salinimicrobium sp.]|nr:RDD family protein [Salinimicrobium sp.]
MDNFQIETAQNVSISQKTAGIGERILAFLIDAAILISYEIIVSIMMGFLNLENINRWIYASIMGLPLLLYFLLWETFWDGRTPGKAVLKLRVVKLDGSRPTFSVYLIRWLLRFIDITITMGGVAVVSILFSGKGQRVGDIAAGTTVISETSRIGFNHTILVDIPENHIPKYPQVTVFKDEEIQTIKNLYNSSKSKSNYNVIISLSKRVADVMEVVPEEKPIDFLHHVIMDYNYYTQQS